MGGHKEDTSTVLLAVCMLRALSRNGFTCHNIYRKMFWKCRFKYLHIYSSVIRSYGHLVKKNSRRMRWAGHVTRMGETRNAYRILVGKQEWKRPLGRTRPTRCFTLQKLPPFFINFNSRIGILTMRKREVERTTVNFLYRFRLTLGD
jgi:hypothetical protein